MAIHPDDPPYSHFGLPRVVKNRDDLDWICQTSSCRQRSITLCTGSVPKILIMTCTRQAGVYAA
ncbi:mannonate dehydratase [Klebsiella pneumoniae]|nr:mannonate dehydratase [Klebsiella pneumoniae]